MIQRLILASMLAFVSGCSTIESRQDDGVIDAFSDVCLSHTGYDDLVKSAIANGWMKVEMSDDVKLQKLKRESIIHNPNSKFQSFNNQDIPSKFLVIFHNDFGPTLNNSSCEIYDFDAETPLNIDALVNRFGPFDENPQNVGVSQSELSVFLWYKKHDRPQFMVQFVSKLADIKPGLPITRGIGLRAASVENFRSIDERVLP